jgi:hypothetical protein
VGVNNWTRNNSDELKPNFSTTAYSPDGWYRTVYTTKGKTQAVSTSIPDSIWPQWYNSGEILIERSAWLNSVEGEKAFWNWCDSKRYFICKSGTDEEILEKYNEWSNSNSCECTWLESLWHQEAFNRWSEKVYRSSGAGIV